MKKIVYYISDHGRGHASRSVAIIRELHKLQIEVIIRNSNSIDFLNSSLSTSSIVSGTTDVGPIIRNDGISIDIEKSIPKLHGWINELDKHANHEKEFLQKIKPDLLVSDISAMPFIASNLYKTNSVGISNFSWYDVLNFLSSDDLSILKNAYDNADLVIKLPFGTKMEHFPNKKSIGLISRIPTKSKKEIRNDLRINESDILVSIFLPSNDKIMPKGEKNTVFLSMNSNVVSKNCITMPENMESQNAIMASDLVICKCGYGMISECFTNAIPLLYVSSDSHSEQIAITKELNKINSAKKITIEDINNIYIDSKFLKAIPKSEKKIFENNIATEHILEFLKN